MEYQTDDILIDITNPTDQSVTVGMFDTLEDKRPIKVGSIKISSTIQSFFHSNKLVLPQFGTYFLQHYPHPEDPNSVAIYDRKSGIYLGELQNVVLYPKYDQNRFLLQAYEHVIITISTKK